MVRVGVGQGRRAGKGEGQGRAGQGQMGRMVESWMVSGGWWMEDGGVVIYRFRQLNPLAGVETDC